MNNYRTPIMALLVCLSSLSAAAADDMSIISATGFGTADPERFKRAPQAKMMARRAAKVDAQRNLLEAIDGVRITAGTTVKDMALESDVVGTRVKGIVQGAFVRNENVYEDDGAWVAEVELGICMNGGSTACEKKPTLAALVQPQLPAPSPESIYKNTDLVAVANVAGASTEEASPALEEASDAASVIAAAAAHTGLIVDLSGKGFSPMLDVRVRTAEGKELYGPGHVGSGVDWLHWAGSLDGAKSMADIVGNEPLVIAATGVGENLEVLVSSEDAVQIFSANVKAGDFLKSGSVVFVVN